MVATQESVNSRFCSVVEIKLIFFLKGGHLPGSGSIAHCCFRKPSVMSDNGLTMFFYYH